MLLQWIKDNAVLFGGVVTPTITGLFALLIWLLSRKGPNKLRLYQLGITSLLNIDTKISQKVAATYDSHPVKALSQANYAIINAGHDDIKDIKLTLAFAPTTTVLELRIIGVPSTDLEITNNKVAFQVPLLNHYRGHTEVLMLKVLCDGSVDEMTVSGRGPGWSVEVMPLKPRFVYTLFIAGLTGWACLMLSVTFYKDLARLLFGNFQDNIREPLTIGILTLLIVVSTSVQSLVLTVLSVSPSAPN